MLNFINKEPISKGWSCDKKYCVTTADGTKYLLRVTPFEKSVNRENMFRMQKEVEKLGVPMCKPVDFGKCNEGVYTLQTWIDGKDANEVVPYLADSEQYALGLEAGRILKKIHSIPAPADQSDWEIRFNKKMDRKIQMYNDCPIKFDGAEYIIDYIEANRHLLKNRPQCYQHGDYHIGNMMIENGRIVIIDFDRYDFGDPWEEFNRIVWCAQSAPIFASGIVNGYFDDEVPMDFWKLLALYISSNMLSSIPWAIPFGDGEVQTMLNQAKDVLEWYDNMQNPVPKWYKRKVIIMDKTKAIKYILQNARPLELAIYKYFFENQSNQAVIDELFKFQNADGGFGNALEPDFFNPNSSPIATNDAIITLHRVNALNRDSEIVKGIVRYLESHDSFDEYKKRWLFAIDSNKGYPHAIWWEKKDDGISNFNPSISLAAFMVCYSNREPLYEEIVKDGFEYLENTEKVSGDDLNCFLLAYELLRMNSVNDVVDMDLFKDLLCNAINNTICKDIEKYGIEYVPMPSSIFAGTYLELVTSETKPLITAEKDILGKLQMDDGGFDITWKWYTPYTNEYEQARAWWRPRITIDKLIFNEVQV